MDGPSESRSFSRHEWARLIARMPDQSKKWVLAAGIFVFLLLSTMEIAMRALGVALLVPSTLRNRVDPSDAQRIRILALGESTTADLFSDESDAAWPRQLERELRSAGYDVRVYNEGLAGTMSPMILSHLPGYLEKYHPHIVISMMGINDGSDLMLDPQQFFQGHSAFSGLRIVKLAAWLSQSLRSRLACSFEYDESGLSAHSARVQEGLLLAQKLPASQVENELRKYIPKDSDFALAFTEIGTRLLGNGKNPRGNRLLAKPYFDRAFDLRPFHHKVAFWQLDNETSTAGQPSERCVEASRKLLSCAGNISDDLLTRMASCTWSDPSLAAHAVFQSRGFLVSRSPTKLVGMHYRMLHDVLRRERILHVAMQYPTLPLERLQAYFTDREGRIRDGFQDIVFAGNEINFAAALGHYRYEEIFSDRFRDSWGHTTVLGHRLIAENLSQVLAGILGKSVAIPVRDSITREKVDFSRNRVARDK